MSSYLFHNAVVLLTRRRLSRLVGGMERKRRLVLYTFPGNPNTPQTLVAHRTVEDRVFALAGAAHEMLGGGGAVTVPAASVLSEEGTGKFAVMGSIGLELPSMVEYLRPGQEWITSIIRRGSADPNYSSVVVPTTRLALRIGEIALGKVGSNAEKRRKIEAFVMGMLCSVAVEVVANPILRGMQAAKSFRDWDRFSPPQAQAAADAIIARDLLGSPSRADWESWWPTEAEVPEELFQAYDEALRTVYPLAQPNLGFIDFAATFEPGRRPDARDLKNAYSLFRHGNITVARSWSAFDWWPYMLSIWLPPVLGALIAAPLPRARDLFTADADLTQPLDTRAASEVLTTGYLTGIFTPFGTSMALHSLIPDDMGPYIESIILFVLRLLGLATFIGFVAGDASETARWILFGLLCSTDLYAIVRGVIDLARGRRGTALLYFIQAIPLLTMGLTGLIAVVLRAGRWSIFDNVGDDPGFLVTLILSAVLYAGLALFTGWLMSLTGGLTVFLRERRDGVPLLDALPGPAGDVPRSLAHLFDDATLWRELRDPGKPLATHRYPAGRRVVLDLRWTGDGDLEINPRANVLTFLHDDGTRVEVKMRDESVTAVELKALLESRVPGLEANLIDDEPADVRLPAPETFSDPGDEKSTFPLHDTHVGDFLPIGKTDDTMFRLRHAPRSKQTTTFGTRGQGCSPLDSYKLVPEKNLHDLDASALGMASDLAALLCMGGARHLRTTMTATAVGGGALPLAPAFRVMRQWNLDERRINEWRAIVHGGARSERYTPNPPATQDDEGMLPGAPASTSPGGAALTDQMGWIPLFRAWSRIATDPAADATAAPPQRYTPAVATGGPGAPAAPGNLALSDAMRFLLDLVA